MCDVNRKHWTVAMQTTTVIASTPTISQSVAQDIHTSEWIFWLHWNYIHLLQQRKNINFKMKVNFPPEISEFRSNYRRCEMYFTRSAALRLWNILTRCCVCLLNVLWCALFTSCSLHAICLSHILSNRHLNFSYCICHSYLLSSK